MEVWRKLWPSEAQYLPPFPTTLQTLAEFDTFSFLLTHISVGKNLSMNCAFSSPFKNVDIWHIFEQLLNGTHGCRLHNNSKKNDDVDNLISKKMAQTLTKRGAIFATFF